MCMRRRVSLLSKGKFPVLPATGFHIINSLESPFMLFYVGRPCKHLDSPTTEPTVTVTVTAHCCILYILVMVKINGACRGE